MADAKALRQERQVQLAPDLHITRRSRKDARSAQTGTWEKLSPRTAKELWAHASPNVPWGFRNLATIQSTLGFLEDRGPREPQDEGG